MNLTVAVLFSNNGVDRLKIETVSGAAAGF
jgi:hypothetical protein